MPKSGQSSRKLCGGCALRNQAHVKFQSASTDRSKSLLVVVHSDVCGPMRTLTFGKMKYFITFIDDKSRHCAMYLMRNKTEVYNKFVHFEKLVKNLLGNSVKMLCNDTVASTSQLCRPNSASIATLCRSLRSRILLNSTVKRTEKSYPSRGS